MKQLSLATAVLLQSAVGLSAAPVLQSDGPRGDTALWRIATRTAPHLALAADSLNVFELRPRARRVAAPRELPVAAPEKLGRAADFGRAPLPPGSAAPQRGAHGSAAELPLRSTRGGTSCGKHLCARERIAAAGRGARPFAPLPFRGLHTETLPYRRVGIWGSHQRFRTVRGWVAVGLEGGGAVRLRERVNLTAGFRLLHYGRGEDNQLESGNLDAGVAAPFLGLALRF